MYRKSYTRRIKGRNIRVPGRCIRSMKISRVRGFKRTRRGLTSCPSGFIKRSAYVRHTKKGKVYVPEQCIIDRGNPGKGFISSTKGSKKGSKNSSGIGPLRKGELGKHGYAEVRTLTEKERHTALNRAIREYGSLGVWRKLNAVAVYTKHTSPQTSAIFKSDMKWIRETYGIKAFT